MRSPDAPVGGQPTSDATVPPPSSRAGLPKLPAFSLSNWPVSRRLVALIVIAVVMGLVFGGLRVASATATATGFARTTQLAVLGQEVTALAQAMENERDLTAAVNAPMGLTLPAAQANAIKAEAAAEQPALQRAQAATDAIAGRVQALAAQVGGSFPANTQNKAQRVIATIGNLAGLRAEAQNQPALSGILNYSAAIADLFALNDEITSSSGDPILADEVRSLGSMSRAKDQASQQRAVLYAALIAEQFPPTGQESLLTAQALQTADLLAFQSSATSTEENDFLNTVAGQEVYTAQLLNNYLSVVNNPQLASKLNIAQLAGSLHTNQTAAPDLWYATMTATIGRMRTIEVQLADDIVARSRALQHDAQQSAVLTGALTGAVLLLVLVATFVVARSLVNPLRRLQTDALEVATVRLPARVAELGETTDPHQSLEVEPVSVHSHDEIGKVARAFDQVHREAVRLAGNEAMLRGNLSAMFISLSRRSVPLIERLARTIDSLEQNEDDPGRLSNLFSMDHLVTRMRRNSENLLVLAGEEPVRKWSGPVPLTDVARAATSEIEQYGRVVLNVQPRIVVSGQAASDVVHLLAEIIENATMFSPRDTPVHVSGQELTSGGVLLEVRDSGVGVSPARLAEMNWRLDNTPLIDVSVSRHMGLFAVSRLAARHGVRVRLRAAFPQGLSALIWLPGALTGRETVPYVDQQSRQLPGESAVAQLRVGGRRVPGRHLGVRSAAHADGQQDGSADGYAGSTLVGATAPAAGASAWFRAKRPSAASASAPGGAGSDGESEGAAGLDAWADSGWGTAETVSAPERAERTAAGLPTRIPGANLFPGAAGSKPATGPGTAGMPALGQQTSRYETEQQTPVRPAPLSRRSPELARSRLSGFQLGSRQAEGRTSSEGEGS